MKKLIALLYLFSCISYSFASSDCGDLKVAAFNIQVFGVTKAGKPDVMAILSRIVRRYDIVVIQEIRDVSMTAIYELLNLVNMEVDDGLGPYTMQLSDRLGRTSSKEQYSFFYRINRVGILSTYQYADSEDYFERPPYSVMFSQNCSNSTYNCSSFWLQVIHTKPTSAFDELQAVHNYSIPAAIDYFNSTNGMLFGDLNADCSYISNSKFLTTRFYLDPSFDYLLNKGVIDTTVGSSYCTYDNFIPHSDLEASIIANSARTFNFMVEYNLTQDFAEDVSDHYPIELNLYACISQYQATATTTPTAQITTIPVSTTTTSSDCGDIKVAAFNVKVFGVTKAGKPDVMAILSRIVRRYDIVVIQEIRDVSMTAIYELLNLVNMEVDDGLGPYTMQLSDRLGRTSSKEQYSFFYRINRVSVLSTYQYADSEDYFERPPYSVMFSQTCSNSTYNCSSFWLQVIHAKPTSAFDELQAVHNYSIPAAIDYFNSTNGMLFGDLNADCSYISNSKFLTTRFYLDPSFDYLLNKGAIDTTVGSSYCTYDNFIPHSDLEASIIANSARTFNFMVEYNLTQDFAEDVSDHYPIELNLNNCILQNQTTTITTVPATITTVPATITTVPATITTVPATMATNVASATTITGTISTPTSIAVALLPNNLVLYILFTSSIHYYLFFM